MHDLAHEREGKDRPWPNAGREQELGEIFRRAGVRRRQRPVETPADHVFRTHIVVERESELRGTGPVAAARARPSDARIAWAMARAPAPPARAARRVRRPLVDP